MDIIKTRRLWADKKGDLAWRYIVLLIIALVVLAIILFSGIWKSIPVISQIMYTLQSIF